MHVVATGVVVDAIAIANVEAVLGTIPPDRALHEPRAESDARRTRIPTEGGQHSDDCGQPMIAA
jgi:hypothetical protein